MGKLKKILLVFLLTVFLFQAGSVFALEIKYPPVPGAVTPQEIVQKLEAGELSQDQVLPLYFKYFFNLSFLIIVIICAGVIVFGGVLYLLSPAKPAILVSAKQWINSALLGLLILVSSYLVLVTINPQLAIFKLPWLPEAKLPPALFRWEVEKIANYTEIPLGQLITEKIIDQEAEKKLNNLLQTVKNAESHSKALERKLQELLVLTENCSCGESNCDAVSKIGLDKMECFCNPSTIQCNIDCDLAAIRNKIEEILDTEKEEGALAELKKADINLGTAQGPIINDWSDMQQASMMINLGMDLVDYYTFLGLREWVERRVRIEGIEKITGKKVEIQPFSSSWPRVQVTVKTYLGKIESQAAIAWEINTDNATTVGNILSTIDEIKSQLFETEETGNGFSLYLKEVKDKIDNALIESTPENISQAIGQIEHYLLSQASSSFNVLEEKIERIATSSRELQEADYQKSDIEKNCQEIEKLISGPGSIREDISAIETLKNEVAATTTLLVQLEKLSEIKVIVDKIESKIKLIWESAKKIVDPATFYLPTSETIKLKETLITE